VLKEKRRAARIKRRMSARLETQGKTVPGIAMQFSQNGLFLQTRHLIPKNTPIIVYIPTKAAKEIRVEGKVIFRRNDQPLGLGNRPGGIGVEILQPTQEYIHFLAEFQT